MQKESLILALFILAAVICLGATLLPKLASSVSDTTEKIKNRQIKVEQVVKA